MKSERFKNYSVAGLVIGRKDTLESDRLLTLFTREKGKLRCIAKGAKKTTSKMAGNIELFSFGKYGMVKGKSLDILVSAQDVSHPKNQDLESLSGYFLIAEIINKLFPEHTPIPNVFDELMGVIEKMDSEKSLSLAYFFAYKAISEMGYGLRLESCPICTEHLGNQEMISIDFSAGRGSCAPCGTGKRYSKDTIKIMRFIESNPSGEYSRLSAKDSAIGELKQLTTSYLEYLTQREIKTQKLIKALNSLPK